jgi:hypothetical protein
MARKERNSEMAVESPEQTEQTDSGNGYTGVTNASPTLINGTSLDNLESRIEAELKARRATMEARAAYGDQLYQSLRAVLGGYRNLNTKNIPAPAKVALQNAKTLLDNIDASTR